MQENSTQPMQPEIVVTAPKPPIKHGIMGGAAAAAMALALAIPSLKTDEGKRNVTYYDIAHLPTECYGHMDRKAKIGAYHTDAQCDAMLTQDVTDKLNEVKACVPQIAGDPYVLAASTRLAFNIGGPKFCSSSIARNFRLGNLSAGCKGFPAWKFVNGKIIKGLVTRRTSEMALCLKGI